MGDFIILVFKVQTGVFGVKWFRAGRNTGGHTFTTAFAWIDLCVVDSWTSSFFTIV